MANQTFKRVYKLESLKKGLNKLKERAEAVNLSEWFTHDINQIKVTSEYPFKAKNNAIKIIYSLVKKEISEEEFEKRSTKIRHQSKRSFDNLIQWQFYPELAIEKFLKGRSHVLKLKGLSEKEVSKATGQIVFEKKETEM